MVGNDGTIIRSDPSTTRFSKTARKDRLSLTAVVETDDGNWVMVGQDGIKLVQSSSGEDLPVNNLIGQL